jgi:hypothetical protein
MPVMNTAMGRTCCKGRLPQDNMPYNAARVPPPTAQVVELVELVLVRDKVLYLSKIGLPRNQDAKMHMQYSCCDGLPRRRLSSW